MSTFPSFFMGQLQDIPRVLRRGELFFSIALISILVVLILPLHKTLLDVSLAVSFAFSIMVLMTVLFLEKPLDFSVFPTVLLVATMLRLALNVASTRLILSNGNQGTSSAGEIIQAFGSFIMGGSFVIGLIVFAILVIINFVVITKGSGRIAEVVARFSLDALPGKQMSVDADLSSGAIDQQEAKKRRQQIQEEINFYGAMDGAAKFVRGDAIAGLLITAINLLGGIIIGVFQQGMTFTRASQTYALLTVGDGLVSQIPALIVSVAAGMLISKTSSEGRADQAFKGQLTAYPAALGMSGVLLSILGALPGMPSMIFLTLAGGVGFAAMRLGKKAQEAPAVVTSPGEEPPPADDEEKKPEEMLSMDELKLELGVGLVSLIKKPEELVGRVRKMRENIAREFGVVVPTVRIVDNLALDTYGYQFKVKEIGAATGKIMPDKVIALDPAGKLEKLRGEPGKEPVLGISGIWIDEKESTTAKEKGYIVADSKALLITHMTETLKKYLPDLFSFSIQQQSVDALRKPYQKMYGDMVPMQISAASVGRILKNLLKERVSIRDLGTIIEAISEALSYTKDPDAILERVRLAIKRAITAPLVSKDGKLNVVAMGGRWSQEFQSAIVGEEGKQGLAMAPSRMKEFFERIAEVYGRPEVKGNSVPPSILVAASYRPFVRSLVEKVRDDIAVLSENEATDYPLTIVSEL